MQVTFHSTVKQTTSKQTDHACYEQMCSDKPITAEIAIPPKNSALQRLSYM